MNLDLLNVIIEELCNSFFKHVKKIYATQADTATFIIA